MSRLLPRVQSTHLSPLTPKEIEAVLARSITRGFVLYSQLSYYGTFSEYDFSVRKVYSRIKQSSLGVTVDGAYRSEGAGSTVTLTITPHPIVLLPGLLLGLMLTVYFFFGLREAVRGGDTAIVLSAFFPIFAVYLPMLWLFHRAAGGAQRFWAHAMALSTASA